MGPIDYLKQPNIQAIILFFVTLFVYIPDYSDDSADSTNWKQKLQFIITIILLSNVIMLTWISFKKLYNVN